MSESRSLPSSTSGNVLIVNSLTERKEKEVKPTTKNTSYNWKHLLPGWMSVGIAASIVATKHILDMQADLNPASKTLQKIMDGIYPSAFAHLTGVLGAGVGIDIVAVLKNGPSYYKEGHNYFHIDLLPETSSDITWAIVWGIHASWKLAAIFAAIEAIPAGILAIVGAPLPFTYIGFALLGAAGIGVTGAYLYSEKWAKEYKNGASEEEVNKNLSWQFQSSFRGPEGHKVNLANVPENKRLNYLKSGRMTGFGYSFFPIVGAVTVVTSAVVGAINKVSPIPGFR